MRLPDVPLSEEADRLLSQLRPRIEDRLIDVNRIPVAVLLWGPGIKSTSPLATVRLRLRTVLREKGHAAAYSEELCDPNISHSTRLQQLVHAQEFDLIISLPDSPGAIAEIHDFAADQRVNAKLLVFLNDKHMSGYSPKSLNAVSSILSCHLEYYPEEDQVEIIESRTLEEAQKIRELKYILGGRH